MTARRDGEYTTFYAAQFRWVARTVYLILRDRERAEDVTQDAFVQLYLHGRECRVRPSGRVGAASSDPHGRSRHGCAERINVLAGPAVAGRLWVAQSPSPSTSLTPQSTAALLGTYVATVASNEGQTFQQMGIVGTWWLTFRAGGGLDGRHSPPTRESCPVRSGPRTTVASS